MRIAQLSPLWESVPPETYGGIELVVSLLTENLVSRGHEVTLFATADSRTSGRLHACAPRAFRHGCRDVRADLKVVELMAAELSMLEEAFRHADDFDIIHNHVGAEALPFAALTRTPVVTTIHNAHQTENVRRLFASNSEQPFISISEHQRTLWPELNFAATIYHGVEAERYAARYDTPENGYLVFLGRMCEEKGPHLAIQIAQATGHRLVLAGKIDDHEQAFFDREIAPHLDDSRIEYIGEVNHEQKVELFRGAIATLFPIHWPEPFGLVMIESLACGTPVLALRHGSVPEIIAHEVTGIIGDSVDDLIAAVPWVAGLSRKKCREDIEQRFSVRRMIDRHEAVYRRLAGGGEDLHRANSVESVPDRTSK